MCTYKQCLVHQRLEYYTYHKKQILYGEVKYSKIISYRIQTRSVLIIVPILLICSKRH